MNMNINRIFIPLKEKKQLKIFILSTIIITIIYFSFSVLLSLFSTTPFPKGNFLGIILFGLFKAFSTFIALDWIILAMFPLSGGLLFANYSFYKCKSSKAANTGMVAGLLAAVCPACILPIIGISSFVTFLTGISIYIRLGALLLVIGSTVFIANKKKVCVW